MFSGDFLGPGVWNYEVLRSGSSYLEKRPVVGYTKRTGPENPSCSIHESDRTLPAQRFLQLFFFNANKSDRMLPDSGFFTAIHATDLLLP